MYLKVEFSGRRLVLSDTDINLFSHPYTTERITDIYHVEDYEVYDNDASINVGQIRLSQGNYVGQGGIPFLDFAKVLFEMDYRHRAGVWLIPGSSQTSGCGSSGI